MTWAGDLPSSLRQSIDRRD